jgi:hypothetical protein
LLKFPVSETQAQQGSPVRTETRPKYEKKAREGPWQQRGRPDRIFVSATGSVRPSLATIERDAEAVHVTPKAMDVLVYLADARGEVVSRISCWMRCGRECPSRRMRCRNASSSCAKHFAMTEEPGGHSDDSEDRAEAAGREGRPKPVSETRPARRRRRIRSSSASIVVLAAIAILLWTAMPTALARPADRRGLHARHGLHRLGRTRRDLAGRPLHRFRFRPRRRVGCVRRPDRHRRFSEPHARRIPELRNPAVRMLSFSPSGSEVTIWSSKNLSWSIPIVGGDLRPGLRALPSSTGRATASASSRIPRHLAIRCSSRVPTRSRAANKSTSHPRHPLSLPALVARRQDDLFRAGVRAGRDGPLADRRHGRRTAALTWHNSRISFPTLLDERTLLYLATVPGWDGTLDLRPDLEDRSTHRVKSASNPYTSLAATADGRRLVVTESRPTASLWNVRLTEGVARPDAVNQIPIRTQRGVSPRLGPDTLIYRAPKAGTDALWKHEGSADARELWSGREGRVIDGPALTADGQRVAFTVQSRGKTWLYVMNSDGGGARRVAQQLDVRGAPAWSPDGKWIAIAALQGNRAAPVQDPRL